MGGELAQPLVGKEPGFFMPLYLTFQYLKNGIYIHINITFGNLGFAIIFLGCLCIQGWGCSCAQKRGLLNFYIRTQTKSTCPQQTYIHNIHNEIKP